MGGGRALCHPLKISIHVVETEKCASL